MKQVVIDGVEYVPKGTVISEATMNALSRAYVIAFGNGSYDPCCNVGSADFREIWNLLREANEELGFRK